METSFVFLMLRMKTEGADPRRLDVIIIESGVWVPGTMHKVSWIGVEVGVPTVTEFPRAGRMMSVTVVGPLTIGEVVARWATGAVASGVQRVV
jgi:hypothetical protein